jgi:Fic family protein
MPYEKFSSLTSNLISEMYLIANGFDLIENVPYQENFNIQRYKFNDSIDQLKKTEDYTEWLDFYIESILSHVQVLKEKYELLESQSKQQSIPNAEKLTSRQQRIYQYLLDYKFIQNSQFSLLFPDISEDSILRDLRVLSDLGLVVKTGKTKSSKYELKH